jgi:signal transduction histidine kinase
MFKSIQLRIAISILSLAIIIAIDFNVASEISLALLYLIPVVIFSYQNRVAFFYSIIFAIIAASSWSIVDYITHTYSDELFHAINWLTRVIISIIAAVAIHKYFKERLLQQIILKQRNDLKLTNQKLQESNNELNKFIGMAAHDIRNPVGNIKMIAEMYMKDETISAEAKEWVRMVELAANNSLQILNDTLNISKIQSGTIDLNKTKTNYIQFVKDCITANKYLADNKQQTISFESTIEAIDVSFDHTRLSQVINNLLTNAIKYSNKNTTITIKVGFKTDAANQLTTNVIDQGLGIDEKFHSNLFSAFTTTSNKPTNNESSTGLGLAIVKKIVELHEGEINFTSEKGKGSNFYFTIPVA